MHSPLWIISFDRAFAPPLSARTFACNLHSRSIVHLGKSKLFPLLALALELPEDFFEDKVRETDRSQTNGGRMGPTMAFR